MLMLELALVLAYFADVRPGFRVRTKFERPPSSKHGHFFKVIPTALAKPDYHFAKLRRSTPVSCMGKGLQKDEPSAVQKVALELKADLKEALRKEVKIDNFAQDFMVVDQIVANQTLIKLQGLRHAQNILKFMRRLSRKYLRKYDVQVEFINDEFVIARWNVELAGAEEQGSDDSVPVHVEAEAAFHIHRNTKVDYMRIDKLLVNGKLFRLWPATTVDSLQADIPGILLREPSLEHFAENFELIQEPAATVKGLAPNRRLLNLLRNFHSGLAATPFKDDFAVRCKRKIVTVNDRLEPAVVAFWKFALDIDFKIPFLQGLNHLLPQRTTNAIFPLKLEGSSTFLFNADGKIRSMKIENGLFEWKYFAYGSNLNADVLALRTGGRSVVRILPQPAVLRDYSLVFNLGPPTGPAAASVEKCANKACHGVLYTLDLQQFLAMLASEGVPTAYSVEPVMVEPYAENGGGQRQRRVKAYTLVSGRGLESYPPSRRYKDLLIKGAKANSLDDDWVKRLESLRVAWTPFSIR